MNMGCSARLNGLDCGGDGRDYVGRPYAYPAAAKRLTVIAVVDAVGTGLLDCDNGITLMSSFCADDDGCGEGYADRRGDGFGY
jgi:hypothetical protein